ncbi:CIDEC protein, partial [Crypturellus soui]|nr:CIDEC protein [Crypturellus soui]
MDYAKSLSLRLADPISKCVSASASMTQQLLTGPAPPPRPYRVCNRDRSLRKGLTARSLAELLTQVRSSSLAPGAVALVLEEDGTAVETEAFFQTLEEGTVLMALEKGETWCPSKSPGYQLSLSPKPQRRIDVARVTFDLYKTSPKDLGCLNVKATLYGNYSMSYDLRCYGARRLVK